jgi:hypothetical protein
MTNPLENPDLNETAKVANEFPTVGPTLHGALAIRPEVYLAMCATVAGLRREVQDAHNVANTMRESRARVIRQAEQIAGEVDHKDRLIEHLTSRLASPEVFNPPKPPRILSRTEIGALESAISYMQEAEPNMTEDSRRMVRGLQLLLSDTYPDGRVGVWT